MEITKKYKLDETIRIAEVLIHERRLLGVEAARVLSEPLTSKMPLALDSGQPLWGQVVLRIFHAFWRASARLPPYIDAPADE